MSLAHTQRVSQMGSSNDEARDETLEAPTGENEEALAPLRAGAWAHNLHSSHSTSRRQSRPLSMIQTYQPPLMDVNEDTIPELLPVFTFLNSHANKLYQEGYFLKLDDQNTRASPQNSMSDLAANLKKTN